MSSIFSHVFIPLAILFIFVNKLKLSPRNIVILSVFGTLPDIDIFLFHRASFHNIFILVMPFLIFLFMKGEKEISGLICFYLASHLILDIFDGGIYFLYPFYNKVLYAWINIFFSEKGPVSVVNYGLSNDIVNMVRIGEPMISSENVGIAVLLAIVVLVLIIKKNLTTKGIR